MPAIVVHLLDKLTLENVHGATHNVPSSISGVLEKPVDRSANVVGRNHDVVTFYVAFGNTAMVGNRVGHEFLLSAGGEEVKGELGGCAGT